MAKAYDKMAVLSYLFMKKTKDGTSNIGKDIDFTLKEVGEGIIATGGTTPTSWSNFVLDLTRKKNTIQQRLPEQVIKHGYDLRKKDWTCSRIERRKLLWHICLQRFR